MSKPCAYDRVYQAGRRACDMLPKLKDIPNVKLGSSLHAHMGRFTTKRSWLRRSLGVHYDGASVPINDVRDQYSQVRGALRRILLETPDPDKRTLRRFRSFVRMYLRTEARHHGLLPLGPGEMMSFTEWIESCERYPAWRKDEIRAAEAAMSMGMDMDEITRIGCFGKVESLEGAKENRIINARCDYAKARYGPFVKSIERKVYDVIPEFVKHIPLCQYPRFISDVCTPHPGESVIATDYTSFEGHFAPKLIRCCEGQLYRYMAGVTWGPLAEEFVNVLSGVNHCKSPIITFDVAGCRMSGDVCTSLGNGFTNLMIMKFLAHEHHGRVRGFVEGDDGLFAVSGFIPTKDDYKRLGFSIKIEVVDEPHHASFCGQVYADETKEILVDPTYVLLTTGWTSSDQKHGTDKTMLQLLRAKAISLAYQCPRCPVVNSYTRALLRLTRGVVPRFQTFSGLRDYWELRKIGLVDGLSDEVMHRLNVGPDESSRLVMAKVYGWTVAQQLAMEAYFDSWTKLEPWKHDIMESKIPQDYRDFHDLCTMSFASGSLYGDPFSAALDWTTNLDVRGKRYTTRRRGHVTGSEAKKVFSPRLLYGSGVNVSTLVGG